MDIVNGTCETFVHERYIIAWDLFFVPKHSLYAFSYHVYINTYHKSARIYVIHTIYILVQTTTPKSLGPLGSPPICRLTVIPGSFNSDYCWCLGSHQSLAKSAGWDSCPKAGTAHRDSLSWVTKLMFSDECWVTYGNFNNYFCWMIGCELDVNPKNSAGRRIARSPCDIILSRLEAKWQMALQVLRDFIYASGCSDRDHDHEDVKHASVMDDSLAIANWNMLCGSSVPQNILSLDKSPCTVHFSMIVPCLKCVTFDTAAHKKSDWTQAHRNDRGSYHGCNQCYCLERGKQRLAMATATVEDNDLPRPCDQRQETQFWWDLHF